MKFKIPLVGDILEGHVVALLLTYCENFMRLIYGIVFLLIARKLLSPEDFSSFVFCYSLAIILYGFSKFSLDAFSIREIIHRPIMARGLVWRLVVFRFLFSSIFFLFFVLFLYIVDKIYGVFLWLIFLQALRSLDSVEWYLRAEGHVIFQAISRMVSMSIVLSLLLYVYNSGYEVESWNVVLIQSLEWMILALMYFFWMIHQEYQSGVSGGNDLFSLVVVKSMPAYLGYVFFIIYSKIDQILLEGFLGHVEYGNYMIAARVNESAVILIGSLNMVLFPKLVRAYNESKDSFCKYVRSVSLFFFFLSLLVVFCVWGVRFFYGFLPAMIKDLLPYDTVIYLSYMVFSIIPMFLFGLRSSYFSITGSTVEILKGGGFGLCAALFLGVPSVFLWGAYGGIFCFFISCLSALFISNFFSSPGRVFTRLVFYPMKPSGTGL
ncbi:MAG: hypothetical protein V7739_11460 [Motiliproteus sp.]